MMKIQKHRNVSCEWSLAVFMTKFNHLLHVCKEVEGSYLGGREEILRVGEKLFACTISSQQKLCLANSNIKLLILNFLISLPNSMEIILPVNIVKRGYFDDLFLGLITEACKNDDE